MPILFGKEAELVKISRLEAIHQGIQPQTILAHIIVKKNGCQSSKVQRKIQRLLTNSASQTNNIVPCSEVNTTHQQSQGQLIM